jgi:hypothetical protein
MVTYSNVNSYNYIIILLYNYKYIMGTPHVRLSCFSGTNLDCLFGAPVRFPVFKCAEILEMFEFAAVAPLAATDLSNLAI